MKCESYSCDFDFGAKYKIIFGSDDSEEMLRFLGVPSDDDYSIPIQPIFLKWNATIDTNDRGFEDLKFFVPDQIVSVKVDFTPEEGPSSSELKDFSLKNIKVKFPSKIAEKFGAEPSLIFWSADRSYVEFE